MGWFVLASVISVVSLSPLYAMDDDGGWTTIEKRKVASSADTYQKDDNSSATPVFKKSDSSSTAAITEDYNPKTSLKPHEISKHQQQINQLKEELQLHRKEIKNLEEALAILSKPPIQRNLTFSALGAVSFGTGAFLAWVTGDISHVFVTPLAIYYYLRTLIGPAIITFDSIVNRL